RRREARLLAAFGIRVEALQQPRRRAGRLEIDIDLGRQLARADAEADDIAARAIAFIDGEDLARDDQRRIVRREHSRGAGRRGWNTGRVEILDQRLRELLHHLGGGCALIVFAGAAADRAHDARADTGIERYDARLRGEILNDDAVRRGVP